MDVAPVPSYNFDSFANEPKAVDVIVDLPIPSIIDEKWEIDISVMEWNQISDQLVFDFKNVKEWPAITFGDLPPLDPIVINWPEFAEPSTMPLPDDFKPTELEEDFPGIPSYVPFWEEKLRELAYYKWQAAGCPNDMADHFWFEAKAELKKFCQNF